MKLKLAVCIFVAVFLSAVIFKVNQVEYIPEYDSGESPCRRSIAKILLK
ncbi:MAG: hypothetical protein ACLR1A_04425 [Eubacterium ventriosum]